MILALQVPSTELLVPVQMATLGLLLLAAHLGGKLFDRWGLSVATGQLLGGVLVGPWALQTLGWLPENLPYGEAVASFSFFIFIFVSLVAFSIGEELHLDRLRHLGRATLVICLIQTALTFVLVSLGLRWLGGLDWLDALIIGAIGMSTAPAATFVILNRLRIEGRLRNILGSVEILSDVIGIVMFSFLVQMTETALQDGAPLTSWSAVRTALGPVLVRLGWAHVIGVGIFVLLRVLVRRRSKTQLADGPRPDDPQGLLDQVLAEHPSPSANIFLIVMASVALGTGIAHLFHLPFFASAAFAGFLVANFHSKAIFDSLKIDNLTALLNLSFFALVGSTVRFDIVDQSTSWLVLLYVVLRTLGKVLGTWVGCRITCQDRKIASCLPYLLLPQAGVAAVEAIYAASILNRPMITAVMLPSIVLFEIAGVIMSERTLRRWRSWVSGEEAALMQARQQRAASAVDRLRAVLGPDRVLLDLTTPDKESTLASLVDRAAERAGPVFNGEEALQMLKEREQLMPTGMGHGIAIPHCRLLGLDRPLLILARHRDGVVFGGVDQDPCRLIALLLSGAGAPEDHLRLLAGLAQLLGDAAVRQALLEAPSVDDFLAVIDQAAQS